MVNVEERSPLHYMIKWAVTQYKFESPYNQLWYKVVRWKYMYYPTRVHEELIGPGQEHAFRAKAYPEELLRAFSLVIKSCKDIWQQTLRGQRQLWDAKLEEKTDLKYDYGFMWQTGPGVMPI